MTSPLSKYPTAFARWMRVGTFGGHDRNAREALEPLAVWLGRFAGDAAPFFGACGGVYIGGGIAPKVVDALSAGAFRHAFEAKGRMAPYLAPIPRLCDPDRHTKAALKGAAAALAGRVDGR